VNAFNFVGRCLAMDICSDSDIQAFRQHATILSFKCSYTKMYVNKTNDKVVCTAYCYLQNSTENIKNINSRKGNLSVYDHNAPTMDNDYYKPLYTTSYYQKNFPANGFNFIAP
jgi:hypothetical protein